MSKVSLIPDPVMSPAKVNTSNGGGVLEILAIVTVVSIAGFIAYKLFEDWQKRQEKQEDERFEAEMAHVRTQYMENES